MLLFINRQAARNFKGKNQSYKIVDLGDAAINGKRWAVQVLGAK